MKILWVKANKLLPVHSGGDIRSYHLARCLSARHELTFLSYYDGHPDSGYEAELKKCFPDPQCICTHKGQRLLSRTAGYFAGIRNPLPYAVGRFSSASVKSALAQWFEAQSFDVAVCDFLDATVNFPRNLSIPSVLFQHNVESEIWRRHATTRPNPAGRAIASLEFRKMLAYEKQTVRKFDHVIAVSDHDRQLMSAWVDDSRITVVPTGVDLQQYQPGPVKTDPGPLVLFTGAMDWEPNIDAVEYFCREIWPAVQTAIPEARFRIVGRNPGRRVKNLASTSVEIAGRVRSVVEHLQEALVVVVPLRIGGGTRLKIYEAMATGKAVVSTSIGAEGLDVRDGQDILLADQPGDFARQTITLLHDRQFRHQIERAAATLASRYDWPVIADKFAEVLQAVVAARMKQAEPAVGEAVKLGVPA